ncbi:MAG: C25 family cysteine peptidase, partial [Bacteroidales bacterium]
MNIFKSFLTAVLTVLVLNSFAQVEIKLNTSKSEFRVLESSPYKIKAKASVDKIKTMPVSTVEGTFIELGLNGFSKIYDAGKPQLPVYNKLIEIPYGAEVKINIISYTEQNIQLSSTGIVNKLMPAQPSVSKSADPSEIPFYYDRILYQTNAFTQAEMVTVTQTGTMRGVQVGNLTVAPFRYNPVTNTLKVYNDLVFEVVFKHPDIALTEQMKEKYYSPYFESSLGTLINYTPPAAKDEITQYPVKYVIIAYSSTSLNLQTALQPFVYWKRQKGFNVIEQYYSSVPSTTTIKTYLQGLYDAATPTDPAPTFVLLVGDVGQIPTYTGIADNAHKTDLYYFTMDGTSDYLADMYYGRFSATSTTHVNNQVNKTLQYEKYTMPKKTYMDTVVMVAGYDSYGNDATYGNGQINYGTNNYFNASHGMYTYTFLDPNNTEAIAGANMRAAIYKGVGYANYTAHCSSGGWGTPEFSTSQIANMYNADKYGLLVGNCCQSNTFNDTECFGEALLRAYSNKGAVGYIGASDYSYWDEDYYWGVGARSSIQVNPTYDANNLGSYDCMFHEHGEAKTKWFVTNDQMRIAGLLAVEASSSTMKKYYWEEYHLMGDPSVMNYFSVPDPLTVNYTNPQNVGINSLVVNTEEDAYVAISHNGVLYDAELALAGGVVTLNFAAITSPDTLDVVVTKQNKQPFIGTLRIMAASIPLDAEMV